MENLLERESIKRVIKKLEEFDSSLKVEILNSSARTAEDAALSLNCQVGAIVKSLLLRANDNFILCLVSGDKRCSLNKIKKIINMRDVSMADAEQVKNQTGFSIGGVSPIGHMKKINILIDKSLSRFEYVYAAAGHPHSIFKITYNQLVKLTNAKEEDII
jgi:Cys-tRNA(Pro) deacylase|tara:strand:- start:1881 stop:2360 length:480 start_codon:yes stop_codon:yes gene_type:complete